MGLNIGVLASWDVAGRLCMVYVQHVTWGTPQSIYGYPVAELWIVTLRILNKTKRLPWSLRDLMCYLEGTQL